MIQENTRFLIVGLGLIGGSYAMGLKKNGYHVDAIEINGECTGLKHCQGVRPASPSGYRAF